MAQDACSSMQQQHLLSVATADQHRTVPYLRRMAMCLYSNGAGDIPALPMAQERML
jgi:hypothetical protein